MCKGMLALSVHGAVCAGGKELGALQCKLLMQAAVYLKLIHRPTQAEMLKDAKQELCSFSRTVDISIVRVRIQQHISQLI